MYTVPAEHIHTVDVSGVGHILEHGLNCVRVAVEGGSMEWGSLGAEVVDQKRGSVAQQVLHNIPVSVCTCKCVRVVNVELYPNSNLTLKQPHTVCVQTCSFSVVMSSNLRMICDHITLSTLYLSSIRTCPLGLEHS